MSASIGTPISPPEASSQNSSVQTPPRPRNKRARPPISCLECRRKKLRCDRIQPCLQCKKGGRETLCVFVNKPSVQRTQAKSTAEITLQPSTRLQSEFTSPALESKSHEADAGRKSWMANRGRPVAATPGRPHEWHSSSNGNISQHSSLGFIHVKGARSRYLGLGDRMAMLSHVRTSCSTTGL